MTIKGEKFKFIITKLSDQVACLTDLVLKMQTELNQLQLENQILRNSNVKTIIPWDQSSSMNLIQSSSPLNPANTTDPLNPMNTVNSVNIYSSSPSQSDIIMNYFHQQQQQDEEESFMIPLTDEFDPKNVFRTADTSTMMGYYNESMDMTIMSDTVITEEHEFSDAFIPLNLSPTPSISGGKSRKITRKANGPLKILIVEDDPLYQQLISRIIKSLHIGQCEVVADGVEAVINMSTNSFDLILMDMQLPHLDGLQATQNIRKFNRRTPIISMTARVGEEDVKRYLEGGIDDVLPKPFDKQSVRRIIEQFYKLSIQEEY